MLELKKYADCLVLAPKQASAPSLKKVPAAVYSVNVMPDGDIVLIERVKQYTLPEKIYGVSHKRNLRILGEQYEERSAKGLNTGVMITGFKGSGKTLLAESAANQMISRGRPVFYINRQLSLETLTTLAKYASPCMFLFDEFEKVYAVNGQDDHVVDQKEQNKVLTFFSSTEFGGVLSALISNSSLSNLLRERPQRMLLDFCYGPRTRDHDFEVAMDELGFTPYLKTAMLLGDGSGSRNIDCLLTVANAVEKNYVAEDPSSGERVMELLNVLNVDLRIPTKLKLTVTKLADSEKIGLTISAQYCIVDHEAGVHVTITNKAGKVVFEKQESFSGNNLIRLPGLDFVVSCGESLPFNADLVTAGSEVTLTKEHLELLSEVAGTNKKDSEDTLVEVPQEFSVRLPSTYGTRQASPSSLL